MKTYEEEKNELVAWCQQAYAEAEKKIEQLPRMDGLDNRGSPITHEVIQEWNRRLRKLKEKHNMSQPPF